MTDGPTTSDRVAKFFVPVAAVVLSAVLSAVVSRITVQYTANQVRDNELAQGRAVFDDVGYRYFSAIFLLLPIDGDGQDSTDPEMQAAYLVAYRIVLADIEEDLQWLRTNPIYAHAQEPARGSLAYLQNSLVQEIALQRDDPSPTTLRHMCDIYNSSERWKNTTIANDSNYSLIDYDLVNNSLVEYTSWLCEDVLPRWEQQRNNASQIPQR